MNTFEKYRAFIREYRKVYEPLWQSCNGPLLSCIWEMTPREMKRCVKVQYHRDSELIGKYPLWFLGDALQGHMPYEINDEEWNAENYEIFDAFTEKMYQLMKKYQIAPKGWLRWYNGCKKA